MPHLVGPGYWKRRRAMGLRWSTIGNAEATWAGQRLLTSVVVLVAAPVGLSAKIQVFKEYWHDALTLFDHNQSDMLSSHRSTKLGFRSKDPLHDSTQTLRLCQDDRLETLPWIEILSNPGAEECLPPSLVHGRVDPGRGWHRCRLIVAVLGGPRHAN